MNNLSDYITLKMGKKFIFKEPLQALRFSGNNNYMNNMNSNVRRNSYYSKNNNSNNSSYNNQKRNYEGMDIIPKFIANENMKEINNELLDKLLKKKIIFNKMMNTYFSGSEEFFSNSIQEVENEINKEIEVSTSAENKDFEGFMDLLSFINSNRTNPNLTAMQKISLDEYRVMSKDKKNQILGGIFENRQLFSQKLNLKFNANNFNNTFKNNKTNYNFNENPYLVGNQIRGSGKNMINRNNNNRNYNTYNKNQGLPRNSPISQDQIDLFKIFIGNQKISNQEVLSYLDMINPKVMVAAERYFKKKYGTDTLILQYYYPTIQNIGVRTHRLRFTSELSELFMAAHQDYATLCDPKLYLENGREIINDKKIKCIGALGLPNNAKIKVLFKK